MNQREEKLDASFWQNSSVNSNQPSLLNERHRGSRGRSLQGREQDYLISEIKEKKVDSNYNGRKGEELLLTKEDQSYLHFNVLEEKVKSAVVSESGKSF